MCDCMRIMLGLLQSSSLKSHKAILQNMPYSWEIKDQSVVWSKIEVEEPVLFPDVSGLKTLFLFHCSILLDTYFIYVCLSKITCMYCHVYRRMKASFTNSEYRTVFFFCFLIFAMLCLVSASQQCRSAIIIHTSPPSSLPSLPPPIPPGHHRAPYWATYATVT